MALPETESLWYMAQSPGHRRLLKHPVITSFLWMKWQRIRKDSTDNKTQTRTQRKKDRAKAAKLFYVTDGNIMYLTDASRSLISCVIQHYAPGGGGGGGEEQMYNVDYDPGP